MSLATCHYLSKVNVCTKTGWMWSDLFWIWYGLFVWKFGIRFVEPGNGFMYDDCLSYVLLCLFVVTLKNNQLKTSTIGKPTTEWSLGQPGVVYCQRSCCGNAWWRSDVRWGCEGAVQRPVEQMLAFMWISSQLTPALGQHVTVEYVILFSCVKLCPLQWCWIWLESNDKCFSVLDISLNYTSVCACVECLVLFCFSFNLYICKFCRALHLSRWWSIIHSCHFFICSMSRVSLFYTVVSLFNSSLHMCVFGKKVLP